MNQRKAPRTAVNLPVKLHFFQEQVEFSTSEDISQTGFFVRTPTSQPLDKGVLAVVSIDSETDNDSQQVLAEVVRITDQGAAFRIIDHDFDIAS